jgi:hypothetical protein
MDCKNLIVNISKTIPIIHIIKFLHLHETVIVIFLFNKEIFALITPY